MLGWDGWVAWETTDAPHRTSQVYLVQSVFSKDGSGLISNRKFWVALLEGLEGSEQFKDLFCEYYKNDRQIAFTATVLSQV